MIYPSDLRRLIKETLEPLGLYSLKAQELLMLTAAVESKLGSYLWQSRGPAIGIFQMEPRTHDDIWDNYISRNREYALVARQPAERMAGDLYYAVFMARMHYRRVREPIPDLDWVRFPFERRIHPLSKQALADYWKQWYNTKLGRGDPVHASQVYSQYASLVLPDAENPYDGPDG